MLATLWQDFKNGIIPENPLLRLMIGLCSALAVSTRAESALFMGIAATFVLFFSNVIISAIRKVTADQIRIPIFIVVIASFVTIVDLTMRAFFPVIYDRLGVWIPLIVVNCIILGRAEAFAYRHGILRSAADGMGMGVGYTGLLLIMGIFRETVGSGKMVLFDKTLFDLTRSIGFSPPRIVILFPGAFLTFGFIMALLNKWESRRRSK